jgi:hypothetical protein
MSEGNVPYLAKAPVVPPHTGTLPLSAAQLARAWFRIAWDMVSEVAAHVETLPVAAHVHVAQALASLTMAKTSLEQERRS